MKKIITDQELQQQVEGEVFLVTGDMILTPSAKDYALNKGIRLEYAPKESTTDTSRETSLEEAIRDMVLAELGDIGSEAADTLTREVKKSLETTSPPPSPPKPMPVIEPQGASANMGKRAVITTTGNNGQGIVAGITEAISAAGGDIVDISQTLVGDYFTMILVIDLSNMASNGMTFHAFQEQLLETSKRLGVDSTVMHEDILNAMHRI